MAANTSGAMQCLVCNAAAAVLWCHNDAAFLCVACDARIHSNLVAARHARVTLCEMCERKPATLYCTQDAAALCDACSAEVHASNPLAARHTLGPAPAYAPAGDAGGRGGAGLALAGTRVAESANAAEVEEYRRLCEELLAETEAEAPVVAPGWDLRGGAGPGRRAGGGRGAQGDPFALFLGDFAELEGDEPLEFSFLEAQAAPGLPPPLPSRGALAPPPLVRGTGSRFGVRMAVTPPQPPVGRARVERPPLPAVALPSSSAERRDKPGTARERVAAAAAAAAEPLSREARVLRWKEKRRNRKFDKTIRYASRKAYAEARPRVKGRFAKRGTLPGDEGYVEPSEEGEGGEGDMDALAGLLGGEFDGSGPLSLQSPQEWLLSQGL